MRKPRSNHAWYAIFALMFLAWIWLPSCHDEEILRDIIINAPEEPVDTTAPPVSFINDIMPFFDESCNYSPCHSFGKFLPDLSPANGYKSLIDGGYINLEEASQSQLYQSIEFGNGKGNQMPPGAKIVELNELVLLWIKQGAPNN